MQLFQDDVTNLEEQRSEVNNQRKAEKLPNDSCSSHETYLHKVPCYLLHLPSFTLPHIRHDKQYRMPPLPQIVLIRRQRYSKV